MKRPAINTVMVELIKERINVTQQARRYGKVMQQSFLAAMGEITMTKTQAEAARTFMLGFKTIIGRYVPELKAIEHSGEIVTRRVDELSDSELADIATGSSQGTAPASTSTH